MAIKLEKNDRIDLRREDGTQLLKFCVGCNWGQVRHEHLMGMFSSKINADIDLSSLMFDINSNLVDYIYSPLYNFTPGEGFTRGKLITRDRAVRHADENEEHETTAGLDPEIITVDLSRINSQVQEIVFFLNIYNDENFSGDFSEVPFTSIRIYEGTTEKVDEVFAEYNVPTGQIGAGMRAVVMGKVIRRAGQWKFAAVGEAYPDPFIGHTIRRVITDYKK